MKSWQADMLGMLSITGQAASEHEIFSKIEATAIALGFEYCAYGLRAPLPLSNPKIFMLSNYPQGWRERYAQANYLQIDPTVIHGRRTQTPIVWSDDVFAETRKLWEEAQSFGLRVGWAQSSLDSLGVGGMLSVSRSTEPLSAKELEVQDQKLQWLVHIAHMLLSRAFKNRQAEQFAFYLTDRESEILKWTADGKSSQDIADILTVSKNTVNFHVKNAVAKLQASNKTAAVIRAAMLGHLN